MGKMPGEVIWHSKPYIYLTDDNREWLVGTWHRMPSVSDLLQFYNIRGVLLPVDFTG